MQIKGKKGESINIQLVMTPQDVYKKLHIPNSSVSSFVGGQSQNLARASADRSLECEGALSGTNKKNLSNGLEPQLDRFDFIAVSCFRSLLISVSFFSSFQQPPKLEFWVPKHPNVNISASLQVLANFSVGGNASSAFWRWLPHAIQQQRCPPLPNPPQSEERLQIACGNVELKECKFPEATSKLHYVKSGLGFEYALAIVPQPPQGYHYFSYSTIAEKV